MLATDPSQNLHVKNFPSAKNIILCCFRLLMKDESIHGRWLQSEHVVSMLDKRFCPKILPKDIELKDTILNRLLARDKAFNDAFQTRNTPNALGVFRATFAFKNAAGKNARLTGYYFTDPMTGVPSVVTAKILLATLPPQSTRQRTNVEVRPCEDNIKKHESNLPEVSSNNRIALRTKRAKIQQEEGMRLYCSSKANKKRETLAMLECAQNKKCKNSFVLILGQIS